jgi:hypothetical protein
VQLFADDSQTGACNGPQILIDIERTDFAASYLSALVYIKKTRPSSDSFFRLLDDFAAYSKAVAALLAELLRILESVWKHAHVRS